MNFLKKIIGIYCLVLVCNTSSFAQSDSLYEVKGTVKDVTSGEAIPGANIIFARGKGTQSDINGDYLLNLPNGVYTFTISYIGYNQFTQTITIAGKPLTIESGIKSSTELDEVEIVADVAKIRETPVAISNISAKQIQEELGARDLPLLLNSTPGVYATQQGGGAGDSRINIRGFDQRYVAVMVDGVPVNDMENGQVYWSNWSGLSEVTRNMQVQRGLGASRLAVPSVGGTMNIITSTIDQKRFFVVKNDLGTNNYRRISLGYNSGLLKNKFGVTLSGSYAAGDGWVDRTYQKTWSYFAKFSYRVNSRNLLVFGFNGAPQEHGQKSTQINSAYYDRDYAVKNHVNADSIYANATNPYTNKNTGDRGLQYNPDWGYVNGKAVNTKVNFFHKPLINLSYFLTINPKLTYSNVLYASFGRGGGTSISNGPSYDKNGTGQLLLQSIYNANSTASPNPLLSPDLKPTSNYIYTSVNNHNWYGTLSTLRWEIKKSLNFTGGLDARYYTGIHYQTPRDLLGADYVQQPIGKDQNLAPILKDPSSYIKKVGDKINIYYASKVTWLGLFTQLEYKKDKWSVFLTLTGNQSTMQNINYFGKKDIVLGKKDIIHNAVGYGDTLYTDGVNKGVTSNPNAIPGGNGIVHNSDGTITFKDNMTKQFVTIGPNHTTYTNNSKEARTNTSEVKIYYGYTAKGGVNYNLNSNHNIFVNVGYMNMAPKYNNVFDRSGLELKNVQNQLILSAELGYGIKYQRLAVNVNGYMTKWNNKPLDFALSKVDPATGAYVYYNVPGVDANLKGLEVDFSYKVTDYLKVEGFGMLADWRWASGGTSYVFTEGGTPLDTVTFDARGVHVGNSPQRQLGGSLRFEPFKGFYFKPQYTFFDKMYSQFDPSGLRVTKAVSYAGMDAWRMPGYGLLDFYMGYTIKAEKSTVTINASMNNVLNTSYMTDASFATGTLPINYNSTNAVGYMGQGRRINVGVKVTF